jgi:hypothetical protein
MVLTMSLFLGRPSERMLGSKPASRTIPSHHVAPFVDGRVSSRSRLSLGQPLDLYRFRIGGWNRWEKNPANNFHGEISDVRIYRGMLSDEEVEANKL